MNSQPAGGVGPAPSALTANSAPETTTISKGFAWLAGALGAAISLSLGELFDRLSTSLTSLVNGVADLVVDVTPGSVVAQSINTLGSTQKPLLIVGIVITSLGIGGLFGVAGRTSRLVIPAGFLLFGLLGGFATGRSDVTSAGASWTVALLAAAIGAGITLVLFAAGRGTTHSLSTLTAPNNERIDRRGVLYGGAALGAVALTTASRVGRTSAAEVAREEILNTTGTEALANAANLPAGQFDDVAGITQHIVPISPEDEFYLIDTAIRKPEVDPSTWTLTITGPYVDRPTTYTYEDLLNRQHVSSEVTLSCVSNPVGGDLVGNALWTGVPLSELLEEAGIQDPENGDHQIFSRSVDGFTCGFEVPLAFDGRTAMVALMMNGEPLPIAHGFPARLVVAGIYGYVSATKWLEEIQVTDTEGVDGFWIPRGWSKYGPVKTQSRIDSPGASDALTAGTNTIAGIAFSPTIGIERVEVGITNAESQQRTEWIPAVLADVESDETWVQWRYDWDAPPGEWFIQVRATDKTGFTQSSNTVAPTPNGAEGYHTIVTRVS